MNSTLKTALPIVLVVVMVFGLTFMSQFTAPTKPREEAEAVEDLPVLVIGNTERTYNPSHPDAVNRVFQSYFEIGTEGKDNRVGFFVRNVRPAGVSLTALAPSCTTCTSIRGTVLPPDVFRAYLQEAAAGSLFGPTQTGNLFAALGWVHLRDKLTWHEFEFNNPRNRLELPAAPDGGETWALLELGFKMAAVGPPAPKWAWFDAYDAKGTKLTPKPFEFSVNCGAREAMELTQYEYTLPDLSEGTPTQTIEVACVSAIRDALPPAVLRANNNDPYVKIGDPQPLTADALEAYSRAKTPPPQQGAPPPPAVNFRCGYRYTVTVAREANGKPMDMGEFSKELFVSGGPGVVLQKPYTVRLHGTVLGFIRLDGNQSKIDFGSYAGDFVQKKEVRLWTERPGVELEVLTEQTHPNFLKPTLGPPSAVAGRTYWTMTVQIPAKEGKQPPWDGIVYLRTKGPNPVTVKVPVSGHGR